MVPTRLPYIGYKLKSEYENLAPEMKSRPKEYTLSSIFLPDFDPTKADAKAAIIAVDAANREYPGIINRQL